jgi:hypothetical protein
VTARFVDFAKVVYVHENDRAANVLAGRGARARAKVRTAEQTSEHVVRLLILDALELPALLDGVCEKRRKNFEIDVILWPQRLVRCLAGGEGQAPTLRPRMKGRDDKRMRASHPR